MMHWRGVATASIVILQGCAPQAGQVIEAAAEAMGGQEAILAATSLVLEGTGTTYRTGQQMAPDADLPEFEIHSYRKEIDLENERWRMEQIRTGHFLAGRKTERQPLVQATDGDLAFDVQADGSATRSTSQVGRDRYAELYHHPVPIVRAALGGSPSAMVGPLRQEEGENVVEITPAGGVPLTVHFDAATGLPTRVESLSYHTNFGDVVIATSFGDWEQSGELMMPGTISQTLGPYKNGDFTVTSGVNAPTQDLAAPEEVASAPEPVAPPVTVTPEEIAPGVWYLVSRYNSVLIEFPTFTAVVEAARNDEQALAIIEAAREMLPDKPLRYVINTHFHVDHSGGIRAAVAEGLTLITHEIHRTYYEEMVARPHTVFPDHLAMNPQPLEIETVAGDGPYELTEGDRTVLIYRLKEDMHADGMLIIYLPEERILIEADAFTPGAQESPFATNLLQQVRDLGLNVDRIAPIHGRVVPLGDLERLVQELAAQAEEGG